MIDTRKFDTLLAEGLLLRGAWVGTAADGREMLCALAALSPDVAREQSPTACPADVMPAWLAHLTPWLDDALVIPVITSVVRAIVRTDRQWMPLFAESA